MKRSELKELLEKAEQNPIQCDDDEVVIEDGEFEFEIIAANETEGQIFITVEPEEEGEEPDDED